MRHRVRPHLTYANVAATLALAVALGGGAAYAANTIYSGDIVDGEVKSADIGNGQVRSVDVRDDALSGGGLQSADLAPNSVGTGELNSGAFAAPDIAPTASGGTFEIADNAVQSYEISDSAIRGGDVADNSLGASDIADDSVRSNELGPMYARMGNQVFPNGGIGQNGDWGTAKSSASCFFGDELISAYTAWHGAEPGEELAISSLHMDLGTETAVAVGASDSTDDHGFEVYAVCLG
jgi:hypothetical protein